MVLEKNTETVNAGVDLDALQSGDRQLLLVIDDEKDTTTLLKTILRLSGYDVSGASSGREALQKAAELSPDLILLDLMMPEMDGFETMIELRKVTSAPVIILSALNTKDKIVDGLKTGADDYVTKPFHRDELIERVRAVLRRAEKTRDENRLSFPSIDLVIDRNKYLVYLQGKEIELARKEFEALSLLAAHAPNVIEYSIIANALWQEDNTDIRNRLKYLIYLLRNKLKEAHPSKDLIKNVNRMGYKLNV